MFITKMAKIAYSLAGDGGGHASRNSVIINKLANQGHKIDVYTSHRSFLELSRKYSSSKNVKVTKIPGMRFEFNPEKGNVSFMGTVKANAKTVLQFPRTAHLLRKKARQGHYDLFISDLDFLFSIASTPYARRHNIPTIRINHHAIFQKGKFDVDRKTKNRIKNLKFALDIFIPKADVVLINSFYMPDGLKDPKIRFVGPVLKEDVYRQKVTDAGHVLVYLKPALEEVLYPKLAMMKDYEFIVYSQDPAKLAPAKNIKLKKFSPGFLPDLASCSCVIGTAGIELPSEAVYLGKPMLAIPEKGQAEQEVNGYFINKEGIGKTIANKDVSVESILNFLDNHNSYKPAIKQFKREKFKIGTKEVLKEIDKALNN